MADTVRVDGAGGAPGNARATGAAIRAVGWVLLCGLALFLLYRQCNVTSTIQELGPYRVAVAVTPDPAQIGPANLHVQVSTANGEPTMEPKVTAQLIRDDDRREPAVVVSKAVTGAYEIAFAVPSSGAIRIELALASTGYTGAIVFKVEAGKSEVLAVGPPGG